jgi:hypothetical protein
MQDILFLFIDECENVSIAISQYLDKEKAKTQINHLKYVMDYYMNLEEFKETITDVIYLELNLQQIDQDMDDLVDTSSKEKLREFTKEIRQMKEEWEKAWEKAAAILEKRK